MVKTPFAQLLGALVATGVSSITVTDSIDDESDALSVSCESSSAFGLLPLPATVLLGYQEGMMWPAGLYTLQSVTTLPIGERLLFTSAAFDGTMKKKRTKSYQKLTLKDLVAKIAKQNGLSSKSDMDQFLLHVDQKNESDTALLKRYAQKYNAIFNIKNGTLIFLSKNSLSLPLFLLFAQDAQSYSLYTNHKFLYRSLEVKYHNHKKNKTEKIKIGSGDPKYIIEQIQKTKAEAKDIGKAKLERLIAKTRGGTITVEGQNLVAGGKVLLIGFCKGDGLYLITNAEHKAAEIFTTTLTLEQAI